MLPAGVVCVFTNQTEKQEAGPSSFSGSGPEGSLGPEGWSSPKALCGGQSGTGSWKCQKLRGLSHLPPWGCRGQSSPRLTPPPTISSF